MKDIKKYKNIISLGKRCNASAVIKSKNKLNIRQPRYVFDDAQIKCSTTIDIINLKKENTEKYFTNYFLNSNFDKNGKNTGTGDWFPHDFNKEFRFNKTTQQYISINIEETIKNYIEKANRFIDFLENKEDKLFFIFFDLEYAPQNEAFMYKIIKSIKERVKNNSIFFLAYNGKQKNCSDDILINYTIKKDTWASAEEACAKWIKSLNILSETF